MSLSRSNKQLQYINLCRDFYARMVAMVGHKILLQNQKQLPTFLYGDCPSRATPTAGRRGLESGAILLAWESAGIRRWTKIELRTYNEIDGARRVV